MAQVPWAIIALAVVDDFVVVGPIHPAALSAANGTARRAAVRKKNYAITASYCRLSHL